MPALPFTRSLVRYHILMHNTLPTRIRQHRCRTGGSRICRPQIQRPPLSVLCNADADVTAMRARVEGLQRFLRAERRAREEAQAARAACEQRATVLAEQASGVLHRAWGEAGRRDARGT
jgi:hypothetical protein